MNNGSDAKNSSPSKDTDKSGGSESDNPLSGLLGGYSSSSDDSSIAPKREDKSTNTKPKDKEDTTSPIKDSEAHPKGEGGGIATHDNSDKKRKRLERVRIWKESLKKKNRAKNACM